MNRTAKPCRMAVLVTGTQTSFAFPFMAIGNCVYEKGNQIFSLLIFYVFHTPLLQVSALNE
jgi:hypothetical protein